MEEGALPLSRHRSRTAVARVVGFLGSGAAAAGCLTAFACGRVGGVQPAVSFYVWGIGHWFTQWAERLGQNEREKK